MSLNNVITLGTRVRIVVLRVSPSLVMHDVQFRAHTRFNTVRFYNNRQISQALKAIYSFKYVLRFRHWPKLTCFGPIWQGCIVNRLTCYPGLPLNYVLRFKYEFALYSGIAFTQGIADAYRKLHPSGSATVSQFQPRPQLLVREQLTHRPTTFSYAEAVFSPVLPPPTPESLRWLCIFYLPITIVLFHLKQPLD